MLDNGQYLLPFNDLSPAVDKSNYTYTSSTGVIMRWVETDEDDEE